MTLLWVALGGAIGSMGRYSLGLLLARHEGFPWGTLAANIIGSFIISVCGGFTTFSAFSLQTFEHMQQHEWLKATANMGGSVLICVGCVWLGWLLGGILRKSSRITGSFSKRFHHLYNG